MVVVVVVAAAVVCADIPMIGYVSYVYVYIYIHIYIYYTHCSITVANLLSHPTIDSGVLGQSSHSHFIRRPRTML
jgi:hypothetical protein